VYATSVCGGGKWRQAENRGRECVRERGERGAALLCVVGHGHMHGAQYAGGRRSALLGAAVDVTGVDHLIIIEETLE
jgi:hypothetical protein